MLCIKSVPALLKHCDRCLIGKCGCKFDGQGIGEDSGKGKVRASIDDEDKSDENALEMLKMLCLLSLLFPKCLAFLVL